MTYLYLLIVGFVVYWLGYRRGGRMFKIIDDKGRLFGRINIIDFFVIVFILLIPIGIVSRKIFYKPLVKPAPAVETKQPEPPKELPKEQVSISEKEYNWLTGLRNKYKIIFIDQEEYDNLMRYKEAFGDRENDQRRRMAK